MRPTSFQILPPVIKNLLIINGLFLFAQFVLRESYGIEIADVLGLHYFFSSKFRPYQLITYMFMHGNFMHLLSNMFALWMFGAVLEGYWGPKRFLTFYLVTGLGAALTHYAVFYFQITPLVAQLNDPSQIAELYNAPLVVGASGSIFGLLLAFGMLFPNTMIYVYFAIPIKAKWFVLIYGLMELFSGVTNAGDNVAHFAHLGGMLFGFFMIRYWNKNNRTDFY